MKKRKPQWLICELISKHSKNVLWMFLWLTSCSIARKEVCFMSEQFNYSSIYAPYFQAFIKIKQDVGYDVLRTKWIFLEFDRFFASIKATEIYITRDLIELWRNTRINDGQHTLYTK